MSDTTYSITRGASSMLIDPTTGALIGLRSAVGTHLDDPCSPGLLRLALPLEGRAAHHADSAVHFTGVTVEQTPQGVVIASTGVATAAAELAVSCQISIAATAEGWVLRARVRNDSDVIIPQLVFPQVTGLLDVTGGGATVLQLARTKIRPFEELKPRVDDLWWVDWPQQRYFAYGSDQFAMKWLDLGGPEGGLTMFGKDERYTTQGLVVDHRGAHDDRIDLRWVHYPFLDSGEEWDSGEVVLLAHERDWHVGARAFQAFTRRVYRYRAPRHIRECLAIRSIWPAVRNADPTTRFDELDRYLPEVADPELGIGEVVLWHWWLHNGLPMVVDDRLGDADQLATALQSFRDAGMPVSMFVSHNIVRDGPESPPGWRHLNAAGQPVQDNWTYGFGFLPRFRTYFAATHAMQQANPLSADWRRVALQEYRKALDLGGSGICFDVFRSTPDPEFNPDRDGRPDEGGVKLIELAAAARELIHSRDPDGTFSGEFIADTKLGVLDYSWDWINAWAIADSQPWRYVFPEFRLNANVGHRRAAVLAFMEGALLNLMPGGMASDRLTDHPDLERTVRALARQRARLLDWFVRGQFRAEEGLIVKGGQARCYTVDDRVLLLVVNADDEPGRADVRFDPSRWGDVTDTWTNRITVVSDGAEAEPIEGVTRVGEPIGVDLGVDALAVIELRPVTRGGRECRA